ncbi:glycosyltransferase family 9 protein [Cytophaga aurantiaca]|uniref:glycosyltransferase family 9 protein n=1 Tax=Cytophaga aurantiaca TaxID=29530 RepID=UPI00036170F7|nr:glycosyltransferase family 9 protein [Cytophaga aurantiaca]
MKAGNLPKSIIISRTDSIGDVIVTLPLAAFLKEQNKDILIYFIGSSYTRSIIEACPHVDVFLDRAALLENGLPSNVQAEAILFAFPDKALEKKIRKQVPLRVGTANRWYHWLYLNKRISFSRKNSPLHESQLNFYLLSPWFKNPIPDLEKIKTYTLLKVQSNSSLQSVLNPLAKKHIIFHTKSKGSAREWPLSNYWKLAQLLSPLQYQVYISGTSAEGKLIHEQCPEIFSEQNVTDITGKFSLQEFIEFINICDATVACSTGPLHISAALNKQTIGIYPPIRPMHAGRWGPLGSRSTALVSTKSCDLCRTTGTCTCIQSITPKYVYEALIDNTPNS